MLVQQGLRLRYIHDRGKASNMVRANIGTLPGPLWSLVMRSQVFAGTVLAAAMTSTPAVTDGPAPAGRPAVVELWPGKVPDEAGGIGAEYVRMSPKLDRTQVEVTEPTR